MTETELLTNEQEKEIGIIKALLENLNKYAIGYIILIPYMYSLTVSYQMVPDALHTLAGVVVMYYFKQGK